MTMHHSRLVIACLLFAISAQVLAWGELGHRLIGELANDQLTPHSRAVAAKLLANEPEPTLAGVSMWADKIRAEDEQWRAKSAAWHYVRFGQDGQCGFDPQRGCANGDCVIGAINKQLVILSDIRKPRLERIQALKFLVHFVGDVHQPLHASARDDKGGNDFQINWRNAGNNLHWAWDSFVLDYDGRTLEQWLAILRQAPALPADPTLKSDRPAVDWAAESCTLVETAGFYPKKRKLSAAYFAKHRPTAEKRLLLAGERLAALLNFALKQTDGAK